METLLLQLETLLVEVQMEEMSLLQLEPGSPVELEEISQIAISGVGAVTTTDLDDSIHEIANLDGFQEPALSVHVYSRPLDTCVVFDLENQTCQRVPLSFHSEYGKVVAAA